MGAESQGNLIIFRIGSIGDTVVALPCFHAISRAFPRHRKILLTDAPASVRASSVEIVLAGTGLIDDAIYFPPGHEKVRHSLALWRHLQQLQPDALVYLAPRPDRLRILRDLLFFRSAGIRRIIGAPLRASVRAPRIDPETGELEQEADRLARALGAAIPVDLSPPNWDMRLTAAEHQTAASRLAMLPSSLPIVAMSPGAKVAAKDWGESNWAALVRILNTRSPPVSLALVGATDEHALAARLAHEWSGPVANLCGNLTPRECAAALARCDVLACHDSGPMHLAANQGTPCVALFGNFNKPRQWFPFGTGHRVIYEPSGVRRISVERVAAELEAAIAATMSAAAMLSAVRPPASRKSLA